MLSDGAKHGNQQNNIVAKMCESRLMTSSENQTIYVEYGAGKAGLSSFVAMKLEEQHT